MKWWGIDYIFLPPKYLIDLKRASPESLSFFENISEVNTERSVKNNAVKYRTWRLLTRPFPGFQPLWHGSQSLFDLSHGRCGEKGHQSNATFVFNKAINDFI